MKKDTGAEMLGKFLDMAWARGEITREEWKAGRKELGLTRRR